MSLNIFLGSTPYFCNIIFSPEVLLEPEPEPEWAAETRAAMWDIAANTTKYWHNLFPKMFSNIGNISPLECTFYKCFWAFFHAILLIGPDCSFLLQGQYAIFHFWIIMLANFCHILITHWEILHIYRLNIFIRENHRIYRYPLFCAPPWEYDNNDTRILLLHKTFSGYSFSNDYRLIINQLIQN